MTAAAVVEAWLERYMVGMLPENTAAGERMLTEIMERRINVRVPAEARLPSQEIMRGATQMTSLSSSRYTISDGRIR
jgi:hypothetical protein